LKKAFSILQLISSTGELIHSFGKWILKSSLSAS
jgi:hypothetical protein